MTKLISSPNNIGLDPDDIRANPGALIEIHDDVLRDLMRTPHALEKRSAPTGSAGDAHRPRRRVCV